MKVQESVELMIELVMERLKMNSVPQKLNATVIHLAIV